MDSSFVLEIIRNHYSSLLAPDSEVYMFKLTIEENLESDYPLIEAKFTSQERSTSV